MQALLCEKQLMNTRNCLGIFQSKFILRNIYSALPVLHNFFLNSILLHRIICSQNFGNFKTHKITD